MLMAIPGEPVMDSETADQVRDLMAKGFAGTVFLTTDDCQASYEELKARGVEFTEDARRAALRDRLRLPRPLGQLDPPHRGEAAGRSLSGLATRTRSGLWALLGSNQ